MGKSIVGGVTIINTLTQKNDGEFPIAMARDIFMNNNTSVEDRINALKNYTHPVTPGYRHIPAGGEMGQFLKWNDDGDAQWVTIPVASANNDGFFSHLDKEKLDNISENANNYVHPQSSGYKHIPSGGESGNILIWKSDGEVTWGTEKTYQEATESSSGLMSAEDKKKLNTISSGAGNYVHPTTPGNKHIPAGGKEKQILRWKADGEAQWDNETAYTDVTVTNHGLMSAEDKKKLDGVASGANNYTHPSGDGYYHIPAGGKEGQYLKYKSAGEAQWGDLVIPVYDLASTTNNGLMSKEDKTKLDNVENGANNYTHPTTSGYKHIPAGGKEGQILRYVSDGTAMWGNDKDTIYTHPLYNKENMGLYKLSVDETGHVNSVSPVEKADITALGISGGEGPTYTTGTSTTPGLTKLYDSSGSNEDGTITQKTLTDLLNDKASSSHTHDNATANKSGFMSAEHVKTLNQLSSFEITDIDYNTDEVIINSSTTYEAGPVDGPYITLTKATNNSAGVMSASDKKKLDGISEGATKYIHPSYTKENMGLYKLSVDETGHVNGVSPVEKSDITALGISGGEGPTYTTGTEITPGLTKLYSSTGSNIDGAMTQKSVTDELAKKSSTTHSHLLATNKTDGFMSKEDKSKLENIASGANNYTHPSYTSHVNGLYKITTDNTGHVSAVSAVTKSDITALGIPSNTNASTTNAGLMSVEDKKKLDGISSGANAYVHPSYTSHVNGLYKVTIDNTGHVNAVNNVVKSDITILGIASDSNASTTSAGLMSADDKKKLDGVASGANNYTHPSYTNRTQGLYKFSVDTSGHVNTVSSVSKNDITALGIPGTDTTYSVASSTDDGLMSAEDKKKLDNIPIGGGTYVHPKYTKENLGLYKLSVDELGHVNKVSPVEKSDITALGISGGQGPTYTTGTETTPGVTKLYTSTGTNEDGSITQKGLTDLLNTKASSSHIHDDATTTNAGFMSTQHVKTLNQLSSFKISDIEYNADNVIVNSSTTYEAGPVTGPYITIDKATETAAGVMSAADKKKLNSISEGATSYKTGTETTSGITKLYNSTGTATDGSMTQKSVSDVVSNKSDLNHTHPDAAEDHAGFMSQTHVQVLKKLNAFKVERTEYSTDSASIIASSVNIDKNDEPYETSWITINGATTTTAGLMSAEDKSKLDQISLPTGMQIGFGATAPTDLNIGDLWIQTNE